LSYLTASNISEFVNGLLGITSPSTEIILKTYFKNYSLTNSLLSTYELNSSG